MLQRLKKLNLAGPLMVAPGTVEQLNEFVRLNPSVDKKRLFVDNTPNYENYKNVGFTKLDFNKPLEDAKGLTLTAPAMDPMMVLNYMGSVMKLSPVRDVTAGVPEGVLLLGGTFVTKSDKVVYARADRIPGDYPKPAEVFKQLEKA